MRRLFRVAFFACGWIGLLLNLVFILVSFNREAEVGSALGTAMEAIWIGGVGRPFDQIACRAAPAKIGRASQATKVAQAVRDARGV